jgi:hypothetical protein
VDKLWRGTVGIVESLGKTSAGERQVVRPNQLAERNLISMLECAHEVFNIHGARSSR